MQSAESVKWKIKRWVSASSQPLLIAPITRPSNVVCLKVQFVKGWNLLYTVESVCFLWCNDQVHKLGLTNLAEVTSLDFAKKVWQTEFIFKKSCPRKDDLCFCLISYTFVSLKHNMTLCRCSEYLESNKETFLLCSFSFDNGSSLLSDKTGGKKINWLVC